ncbi:MAG: hypothetical protein KKC51_02335 [Verrucomicrobia bacterium]|nr:hypothetical protein [Verrucomicrobiota bacterium]
MARIIYGVHGTGHGHAIRALAVARLFPEHEFLFVSHGTGLGMLRREYPVFECPNPETIVAAHRVRPVATLSRLLKFLRHHARAGRSVRELFERFQPEAALTDYEHFVPVVAREMDVPCLSLDHQHIIPLCGPRVPWRRYPEYLATVWAIRRFFDSASTYIATSFFAPPRESMLRIVPPLLRQAVLQREPRDGAHVLAYQGYSTFAHFVPFLKQIARPVLVYGLERTGQDGNLVFKPNAEDAFLDDLAGCRYVICGGGHSAISEALFYGKPVLSRPVQHAIEQFLNAWHVEHLGYGKMLRSSNPPATLIRDFESELEGYRQRIRTGTFCGNDRLVGEIRGFLGGKT